MKPIEFKEQTHVLNRPDALTDLECGNLGVWSDGKQCISCWKQSLRERLSILFYGRLWLSVWSGNTQPPVWLDGQKTVFHKPKTRERGFTITDCCNRILTKNRK